jgi:hypothetical protein
MRSPNKTMSEAVFKMECPACASVMDCGTELKGSTVVCPACQREVLAAEKRAKRNIPWKLIGKLVLAVAVIGITVVIGIELAKASIGNGGLIAGGILGLIEMIAGLFVLIVAVMWALLPVIVYFGMRRIEAIILRIEQRIPKD